MVYGVYFVWHSLSYAENSGGAVGLLARKVWEALEFYHLDVPHCLMWCIWRERNNRHFEDLERSVSNLKLFFLKTLLDWVTVLGFHSFSLVHGFMDFCTLCT